MFHKFVFISIILISFLAGSAQSQFVSSETLRESGEVDEMVDRLNVDMTVKIGNEILGTPRLSTVPGGHVQFTSLDNRYRVKLNFLDQEDEAFNLAPETMIQSLEGNRSLVLTELYMPITGSDSQLNWSRVASSMMSLSNEGGQGSATMPLNNAYMLEDLTLSNAESAMIELRLQQTE